MKMKKSMTVVLALAVSLVAFPAVSHAEDSILDKAGDWVATVGKSPQEKDQILLERRMNRAAKQVQKGMDKAGKDLEKAFK